MPRRAASGHRPSRQFLKFAAAARIACAVMSGWPELPDWPLQSGAPELLGFGTEPVVAGEAGARKGKSRSTICALAYWLAAAKMQARHAVPISDLRLTIPYSPAALPRTLNMTRPGAYWGTVFVDGGL